MKLELIATATFGLEAVVRREIEKLGYEILKSEDAKITYAADTAGIARSNLWLRCADRVLLKMGEFEARTFDELFEGVKALPWHLWISEDGEIPVSCTSVKSALFSVSDCQAITKKAIVEELRGHFHLERLPETGPRYAVKVTLLKDRATLTIDTSGAGLHKRGYRVKNVAAPIKETLAAAMVQLSFWKKGRLLADPFCGSGTIPIEAALIERNIAPGLGRSFASEDWPAIPESVWKDARKEAYAAIDYDAEVRIMASDISEIAVHVARENAAEAGVDDCIEFSVADVMNFRPPEDYGVIICNPPYGERIGNKKKLENIYASLLGLLKGCKTWSLYLITADRDFEKYMKGRRPDKRRKLYNGRLETCYYQFYGERPPKAVDVKEGEKS